MSSDRSLRHRSPASSSRRHPHVSKLPILSKPIDILPKSSSEPLLPGFNCSPTSDSDGRFYRHMTCTNVFSPPTALLSPESPHEVYQKDTKVVVTVTVEGSPGPIRTMVKLGTTVEETIKLVMDKYGNEGRTPRMDKTDASIYELHNSYFSLECLDRSDSIGDVGSRNFYLRKGKSSVETTEKAPDTAAVEERGPRLAMPWPSMVFFPAYVTRKTSKIVRRMRRLWKVLGCLHCSS